MTTRLIGNKITFARSFWRLDKAGTTNSGFHLGFPCLRDGQGSTRTLASPADGPSSRRPDSKSLLPLVLLTDCKVLCPSTQDPLDQVLPALTSSTKVDLELYALIAVIFRDFVQKWYGQITSDVAFVDEVVTVIAHVTRALEERLRKVTLESNSLIVDRLRDCSSG
jgi:hypothetical protein